MEKKIIQQLVERLSGISLDVEPDPYILTKDEEDAVIKHELLAARDHKVFKLKEAGISDGEIQLRLSQINFDEKIDKEKILQLANSNKNYGIWQQQQREKEKQELVDRQAELIKTWTANRIFNLMSWTSKNVYDKILIVDEQTTPLIKTICFFLSNDERFETELNYSFKKGLLIRGISGLGKTHLLKCVEKNELNPIFIISTLEIADEIKAYGEYEIPAGNFTKIYLDDVGTEEHIVKHYGTSINWVKNFIELMYLRNSNFNRLIISTNNNFSEIENKYGFRVRSRIKDMFNIVDVDGKDMRGA